MMRPVVGRYEDVIVQAHILVEPERKIVDDRQNEIMLSRKIGGEMENKNDPASQKQPYFCCLERFIHMVRVVRVSVNPIAVTNRLVEGSGEGQPKENLKRSLWVAGY